MPLQINVCHFPLLLNNSQQLIIHLSINFNNAKFNTEFTILVSIPK